MDDVQHEKFLRELSAVLNRFSMERFAGDTPDYIIANYLLDCIASYGRHVKAREEWYGVKVPGVGGELNA